MEHDFVLGDKKINNLMSEKFFLQHSVKYFGLQPAYRRPFQSLLFFLNLKMTLTPQSCALVL